MNARPPDTNPPELPQSPEALTLRGRALVRLQAILGSSESRPDGDHWRPRRSSDGQSSLTVILNSPANPEIAEVVVLLGSTRLYTFLARTEEELRLGLDVTTQLIRL